jgi:hypothetical protein
VAETHVCNTFVEIFNSMVEERDSNAQNILDPTTGVTFTGVTFFNSGSKSDPTELFPSIVLVIAGEKRFSPPNFNLIPKISSLFLTNLCSF